MEDLLTALEQTFAEYRRELEECEKKSRPTDGLFGFGHSIGDDPCHTRFDERVAQAVEAICAAEPSPEDAAAALVTLLARDDGATWPVSAQWMLRAAERHALPLIPFLDPGMRETLADAYAARYKPWDRLPAQKQVLKALRGKSGKQKK